MSVPSLLVWAWEQDSAPICAAGLRVQGGQAEVLHIGTQAENRRQGSASQLLLALMERLDLTRLEAETDDDSLEFYRRAGFGIRETEGRDCTLSA